MTVVEVLFVVVGVEEKLLSNTDIKIIAILRAKTVITGENITEIIFSREKFLVMASILSCFLNTSVRMIKGDAAMTTQRYAILMMSTTVRATRGKISAIAIALLIKNSPDTCFHEASLVSLS